MNAHFDDPDSVNARLYALEQAVARLDRILAQSAHILVGYNNTEEAKS